MQVDQPAAQLADNNRNAHELLPRCYSISCDAQLRKHRLRVRPAKLLRAVATSPGLRRRPMRQS